MVDSDELQPMSNLVKQTYSYRDDYDLVVPAVPVVPADSMDQSEKVSSKLVCIHRYYPCLHNDKHRTALVFENGVRDVTVKKSYSSIDEWTIDCKEWAYCGQSCKGSVSVEYADSQEESARKKAEKNALREEKKLEKAKLREEIQFEREMKKVETQMRKVSARMEKEAFREQQRARNEMEKIEKQMAKLHMREKWIEAKEEWGVEQAEKKIAKSAKKAKYSKE